MTTIERRGDRGIDHRRDDEEAGNSDARTCDRRVSAPPIVHSTTMKVEADRNAEVTPAMKSTGEFGGDPQILGDAGFGVLVVAADEIELIIAAVGEPARDDRGGEPGAPAALNRHANEDLRNDEAPLPNTSGKNTALRIETVWASRCSMASKIARFQTLMPYWKPTLMHIRINSPIVNGQASRSPLPAPVIRAR